MAKPVTRCWEFALIPSKGGFKYEPLALQAIVLNNVLSVSLTLNAPPQAITCNMVKAINAPVLITFGAKTRFLWTLAGQTLQRSAPNGRLGVLPSSSHDATVRNPAAFNRALVDFLATR